MSGLPGILLSVVPTEYIPFVNKKETFASSNNSSASTIALLVYQLVNLAICFGAFYYAFKCGGQFLDLVGACCCSFCYLVYRLATGCPKAVTVVMQAPTTSMSQ